MPYLIDELVKSMWQVILYLNVYSVTLIVLAVLFACFLAFKSERGGRTLSGGARGAFFAFLAVVIVATLMPQQAIGSSDYTVWLVPGQGIIFDYSAMGDLERSMYLRQQVANLLMFVPLAAAFRFGYPKYGAWGPVVMGLLISLLIEAAQWAMAAGRVVDIDDVIVNATGGAVGALICVIGDRLARADQRRHYKTRAPSHRRS